MPRSALHDAFAHHVWASIRLIDACLGLSPEQLATTVPGTYGSVIDTLRHLVGADAAYLFVLSEGASPRIEEAEMHLAELRAVMVANGPGWVALLDGNPEPDRVVVRHRDDGTDSHAPMGVRLAQVIHHGTDHRSQVCTALTSLGIEPPEIDVWAFAAEDGRVFETRRAG
ncbi:MAG TPA: DinB family protein [Candidatus Limnocylindria bacterium]